MVRRSNHQNRKLVSSSNKKDVWLTCHFYSNCRSMGGTEDSLHSASEECQDVDTTLQKVKTAEVKGAIWEFGLLRSNGKP